MTTSVKREIVIIIICLILGFFSSRYLLTNIRGRVYNCEISPEISGEMKENCRKAKNENRGSK